jgi:hypothetical protein
MPSLFRFLVVTGTIVFAGWAALYALANFAHPQLRDITVSVPSTAFFKER